MVSSVTGARGGRLENRTLLARRILLIRRVLLVLGRRRLVRVVRLRVLRVRLVTRCLIVRILITLRPVRACLRLSTRVVVGIGAVLGFCTVRGVRVAVCLVFLRVRAVLRGRLRSLLVRGFCLMCRRLVRCGTRRVRVRGARVRLLRLGRCLTLRGSRTGRRCRARLLSRLGGRSRALRAGLLYTLSRLTDSNRQLRSNRNIRLFCEILSGMCRDGNYELLRPFKRRLRTR